MQELISIVVPVYNAEKFIKETLKTVINQTYKNWELILVDDASTDNSVKLINDFVRKDKRIKLYDHKGKNLGAGPTRNLGTKHARGRYVAFLDADDLWHPEKLERQLNFVKQNDAAFICTSYEFAFFNGKPSGVKVIVPDKAKYRQVLTNVTVWTSTVMFDMKKLTKSDIMMPNVPRGQDAATWWQVLKKVDHVYGLKDVLAYYRRTPSSLSANKIKAIKRTWRLYREIERYNFLLSVLYLIQHSYYATKRRKVLKGVY